MKWVGGGKKLYHSGSNLPRTLWVCWPAMAAAPPHPPHPLWDEQYCLLWLWSVLDCWGEDSVCRLNSAGERGQPWDEEFPAGGAGHNNRS